MTKPAKYFIDLHWKGKRLRIFSDDSGQTLDSFERAQRLLAHIRYEIDNHLFNADKYTRTKYEPFQMMNFIESWLKEQELRVRSGELVKASLQKWEAVAKVYLIPLFR